MNKSTLTPQRFDALTEARGKPEPRIIWTADGIARRIGTSADFVRDRLVHMPGSPVKQIGGRYCAVEEDLIAFFRGQPHPPA